MRRYFVYDQAKALYSKRDGNICGFYRAGEVKASNVNQAVKLAVKIAQIPIIEPEISRIPRYTEEKQQ